MQDYTRTQKTDTRNDALDDPACVGIRILRYGQHGKCRSQGNKPKRSHSRRFVMQLAIQSNHGSDQHRGTKAKNYVELAEHGLISEEEPCLLHLPSLLQRQPWEAPPKSAVQQRHALTRQSILGPRSACQSDKSSLAPRHRFGIVGNGHMMMLENNSETLAEHSPGSRTTELA
jgi:hypothetical protein